MYCVKHLLQESHIQNRGNSTCNPGVTALFYLPDNAVVSMLPVKMVADEICPGHRSYCLGFNNRSRLEFRIRSTLAHSGNTCTISFRAHVNWSQCTLAHGNVFRWIGVFEYVRKSNFYGWSFLDILFARWMTAALSQCFKQSVRCTL